jgi:hypothetical protein
VAQWLRYCATNWKGTADGGTVVKVLCYKLEGDR